MPCSLNGASTASTTFVNVRGESARPKGRTRYWYALPPKANLRNFLWHGWMDTWKYASFRSIVKTSPWTWFATQLASAWASWTSADWLSGSVDADLWSDAIRHPSWELWNTGCKTRIPSREEGPPRWPPSLIGLSLLVP